MKKTLVLFMVIICFMIFQINPVLVKYASAASFSVGASTWYSWWKFEKDDNMNMKPTLVFGPVISVGFGGPFSLSGVFLYGKFEPEDSGDNGGPDYITRFDSDISLNYNINSFLKIFGGVKYMDFRWDEEESSGRHFSMGPGLGVGLTIPLVNSFYFLTNLSGIYNIGKHEQDSSYSGTSTSTDLIEKGINTNISFAYYIAAASTSITIGFRYQYVMSDFKEESDETGGDDNFIFYGPTLSVVYTF